MLPPGIFLWETGREGLADPTTSASVVESAAQWFSSIEQGGTGASFDKGEAGLFLQIGCAETTIVIVSKCTTSMEVSRYFVENGVLGEWGSVVAIEQTSGRGQLRRHWVSPAGNLHASLVLPRSPESGPWAKEYGGLVSLLCGHMLAVALEEFGASLRIKWPNDLLQSDRKVGGMLIEGRGGTDILGFGLNLAESPPDDSMRADRAVPAAILQGVDGALGPLMLWGNLVKRSKSLYIVLLGELKPSQFVSAMTSRLAWIGQSVLVNEREGHSYQAEILGISPEGGLIIRHAEGEEVLFSGSITPR